LSLARESEEGFKLR